jgi:hypothetical protein
VHLTQGKVSCVPFLVREDISLVVFTHFQQTLVQNQQMNVQQEEDTLLLREIALCAMQERFQMDLALANHARLENTHHTQDLLSVLIAHVISMPMLQA